MDDQAALYRFVVKCDRDFNARIAKAAKAEGTTPTTYVQNHFNEIFGPVIDPEPAEKAAPNSKKPDGRYKKPARMDAEVKARLLAVLASAKDDNGHITLSYQAMARAAHMAYPAVRDGINELVTGGVLLTIKDSGRGHQAVYVLNTGLADV